VERDTWRPPCSVPAINRQAVQLDVKGGLVACSSRAPRLPRDTRP
jgi:hypothetical protein